MDSFKATCSGLVRAYIFPGIVLGALSGQLHGPISGGQEIIETLSC